MDALLAGVKATFPEGCSFVVLAAEAQGWRPLIHSGEDLDFSAGNARYQLFVESRRQREPVVVLDAQADPRFAQVQASFRSAVCCPLLAPWGFAGIVYAEHPERARVFSLDDVERLTALARSLAAQMPEPQQPGAAGGSSRLPVLAGLSLAAVLLGTLMVGSQMGEPKSSGMQTPTRSVALTRESARPLQIAQSFLVALQDQNWRGAYLLSTHDVQQRYAQESFQKALQKWVMDSPRRAWSLAHSRTELLSESGDYCSIRVHPTGPAEREPTLEWTLRRESEGWRVERIWRGEG